MDGVANTTGMLVALAISCCDVPWCNHMCVNADSARRLTEFRSGVSGQYRLNRQRRA
jgi:hypothetical protein